MVKLVFVVLVMLSAGCRVPRAALPFVEDRPHVEREQPKRLRAPRVAAFGPGHSLDDLLKESGVIAATGAVVDGPLVGAEILAEAERAGFAIDGHKAVPTERVYVPVPDELQGKLTDAIQLAGGRAVARVTRGQADEWSRMTDVEHECYAIDLLVISVTDEESRNLGVVTSGTGQIDVQYPGKSSATGRARVVLTADGTVVRGRELARPVLHTVHDSEVQLHVGTKVPVRITTTSTDGQTRTVGGQISYVSTGVQVTMKPTRVSRSQIRLSGSVNVSEQIAAVEGTPVVAERSCNVDQLCSLGEWSAVARLDRASESKSSAWFGLGGLRRGATDTFVVLARPRQVVQAKQQSKPIADEVVEQTEPIKIESRAAAAIQAASRPDPEPSEKGVSVGQKQHNGQMQTGSPKKASPAK